MVVVPEESDAAMGFEALKQEWTEQVLTASGERFERRLAEELAQVRRELGKELAQLRVDFGKDLAQLRGDFGKELHGGMADVRREMSNMRVELLRWSFLFWLGQITVIGAMLSYMLRALSP